MVKTIITVRASVNAPLEKVWKNWISPGSIIKWNNASPDWHTPRATNDFRNGGRFSYRMEAKDGTMGFDFEGTFDRIIENKQIDYSIADGRKVKITFSSVGNKTEIIESFEAENVNSIEIQRNGWQSIMDNFKKYSESQV
jgi:uncharacterized protein YndB with AHSA1/START domain